LNIIIPKLKEYKKEVKKNPKDIPQVAFVVYGETVTIDK
jgi:hypothetical protein